MLAACCKPSSRAGVVLEDTSFGSNLGQPRMHCSGRGNPADRSTRLTTQPLDHGAGKAGKMDQEEPFVILRAQGSIPAANLGCVTDEEFPLHSSICLNVMPFLASLCLNHCNVAACFD